MKKIVFLVLSVLIVTSLTGCDTITKILDGNKELVVINEESLDITVDAVKARSLGQILLDRVPQLVKLREKIEAETGKKTTLTINVQASPDPDGITDIEKNYYFMYVPFSNSDGLVKTYTFLINKGDNRVLVFAENGDDTMSVEDWAGSVGLK